MVPDPAHVMPPMLGKARMDSKQRIAMLDLRTAFDLTSWSNLFNRLQASGVHAESLALLRAVYRRHRCRVRVGSARSRWIHPIRGVPQGGITSPILFVLWMSIVVSEVKKALLSGQVDVAEPPDFSHWPDIPLDDESEGVDGDGTPLPRVLHSGPMALLLHADDLTLCCQSDEALDLCLRAVAKAVHWLRGQVAPDKSVHLITSRAQAPAPVTWYEVRAGALVPAWQIPQQLAHKYLGVHMRPRMRFTEHARHVHKATRAKLGRVGAETSTYGVYDPRLASQMVHHAYSSLLYAAPIWYDGKHVALSWQGKGEFAQTNRALTTCAARVLELHPNTCKAYLLGELGLQSPVARLIAAKLQFWFELLIQPDHRYTRHAYLASLVTHEQRLSMFVRGPSWVGCVRHPTWCGETHSMLESMRAELADLDTVKAKELGRVLGTAWADGDPQQQWRWLSDLLQQRGQPGLPPRASLVHLPALLQVRAQVRDLATALVFEWEQERWRARVAAHPTMRWFALLHPRLESAAYLNSCHDPAEVELRVRLRSAWYPLQERLALIARPRGSVSATCRLCDAAVAEDLPHFVLHCPALAAERGQLCIRLRDVCEHEDVLAVVPHVHPLPGTPGELLLLAAVLGGDLSHHPGLGSVMISGGKARALVGQSAHPALDRLAMLKASGPILLALDAARDRLLRALEEPRVRR